MATKSISKSVYIKDKYLGRNLVLALENAQKKGAQPVTLSKKVKELKGDALKQVFMK